MTTEDNAEKLHNKSRKQRAFAIAIAFLVGILANLTSSLSLATQSGDWQQFARANIVFIFGIITIAAIILIRRNRVVDGTLLIIGGILFTVTGTELLLEGFGLIFGILEIITVGGITFLILPKEKMRRTLFFCFASAILTYGLDFLPLNYRIPAREGVSSFLYLVGWFAIVIMLVLLFRQIALNNIRVKLLTSIFIVLGIVVFSQVRTNLRTIREISEKNEHQQLLSLYKDYNIDVEALTKASAALSISFAERVDIKELLLAQDREAMLRLLTPVFTTLKSDYNIRHLYVENPDGTVFVRIHNPEKHDDDITYRLTADAAFKSRKTVAGVEVGPGRISVRSVSPLWYEDGFIGMVEVGLDYDQDFVDTLKEHYNADYNLWITYDAAKKPGLTPASNAPVAPTNQVFYYTGTNPLKLPIAEEVYNQVLTSKEIVIKFVSVNNQDLAVIIAPMLGYGDRVIGIIEIMTSRAETMSTINQSRQSVLLPAILLIFAGLIALGFVINQVVLRPVSHLTSVAEEQIAGNFSARVEKFPPDEFGDLGRTFNSLSQQLDNTLKGQESIIAERTRNLAERSSYLESSAEVSRTIASITDTNQLIWQVVNLIKERFSLYYVGLFLVDDKNKWAVLQAGTGEAGGLMLERKHRLKIGEGMIGWSIANAKARIALDVGEDAVQFENPLLPETRSEGALPLRSRGRVLGALTIQSSEAVAFSPEIITTLQIMVDQIAIAIDNAQLLTQNQEALEAERRAYGKLSQEDWLAWLQRNSIPAYISDAPDKVHPAEDWQHAENQQIIRDRWVLENDGFTAIIPIKIRGQVLGGIKLHKEREKGVWAVSQLELAEALAEQISFALESARLFDQSQRRAIHERVISEASSHMRETLDIESVLQAAAAELHKALGKVETEVWLDAE